MTAQFPALVSPAGLLKFGLITLVAAAAASGLVVLRNSNTRLRGQVADLRHANEALAPLREDNERTRQWLTWAEAGDNDTVAKIHAERLQAQDEVTSLEKHAAAQHAQALRQAAARTAKASAEAGELASNRDPQQGLTKLEYFQNRGRATPGAAFETVVWAAMNGDDATLGQTLAISDTSRAEAKALIATLPESEKSQYPTPEKLMALFVSDEITEHATAAYIADETTDDAVHVTLSIGVAGAVNDTKLQFQLGAGGWQLVVPESVLARVRKKLAEDPQPSPAS